MDTWEEVLKEEIPDGRPWDDRPVTEGQVNYAEGIIRQLHEEADWTRLYRATMSDTLKDLYAIHKRLGLPWEDIAGTDAARYAT